jgi:cyclopropane fatty-acyl-phospholipid synthase-like methyltransferase
MTFNNSSSLRQRSDVPVIAHESHFGAASRWQEFAQDDAYGYIMTDLPRGDRQAFWRSGEETVSRELLPLIKKYEVDYGSAIEIGCGVGRLVFPLATHFKRVLGLDISPEMVRQASVLATQRKVTNASFLSLPEFQETISELHISDAKVDFIYSLIVFQHIADFGVIENYLKLVSQLLSFQGIAYLQFDTRKQSVAYRVRNLLPDFILPSFLRHGIRRIRRTPEDLEVAFADASLDTVENLAVNTEYNCYVLRKSSS